MLESLPDNSSEILLQYNLNNLEAGIQIKKVNRQNDRILTLTYAAKLCITANS